MEAKEQKENCTRSHGNDGLREIIHLVSPGLHNLDVSGYFSLSESSACQHRDGAASEEGGDGTRVAPPENCRDLGAPPHSCVPDGEWDVNGSLGIRGRMWQGDRGQQGTVPRHVPAALPPLLPLHLFLSPAPPALPFLRLCHFYLTLAVQIGVK